jgi:hypothetical protein
MNMRIFPALKETLMEFRLRRYCEVKKEWLKERRKTYILRDDIRFLDGMQCAYNDIAINFLGKEKENESKGLN